MQRYGDELVFAEGDCGICGVESTLNPDGSMLMHMTKYILDFLHVAGMDALPGALTASVTTNGGIFAPSQGSLLAPADVTQFQKNNGAMIHMLSTRFDITMELRHLCTKNQRPTTSDRAKQIHLMRYLKAFPSIGPVFSSNPANYADGVTVEVEVDASHATHTESGASHTAFHLKVGTCNAPFLAYSRAEDGVSLSPHESEYVGMARAAKTAMYFRQFAEDLHFPQLQPTKIKEDSRTAINLAIAPAISRLSRHIAQKHPLLRWLYVEKKVLPVHVGKHDINLNGMTKTLGPTDFLYFRHHLFHPFRV